MTGAIEQMARMLGVPPGFNMNSGELLVALGVTIATWTASYVIVHALAPRITALLDRRLGSANEDRDRLALRLIRFAIALLGLSLLFAAWRWDQVAAVLIGLNLALAAALLTDRLVKGLGLPGWSALLLGFASALAVVSGLLGGVSPVLGALDRVGFEAGSMRISVRSVLTTIVTALLLIAAVRVGNRLLGHAIERNRSLDAAQKLLAEKLAFVAIATLAFFVGVDLLGIDLTALAVFSGALGLAIGFGFQKTFGNLISGIILLMDRSIKPGDVIVVGDSFGWVNKIGIRAVSVITRDGKEHLIPNENLMTNEVENWSYSSKNVRVRVPVGVAYSTDMALAERLMLQAAAECPRVLDAPKSNVWWIEYGESSVNFEILVWIDDPEEGVGNVRSDVLKRLWTLFKDNGIEIPFPQRDLHLRTIPGSGTNSLHMQA